MCAEGFAQFHCFLHKVVLATGVQTSPSDLELACHGYPQNEIKKVVGYDYWYIKKIIM